MKKLLLLPALLLSINISAQQNNQAAYKQIDEHLLSKLIIEKAPIESPAINKVFNGSFFKIGTFFVYEDENTSASYGCHDCYINITNGKLTEFQQLSSDTELKELFSLLKNDFRLKNETEAAAFEAALNSIFPVDEKEKQNVKHLKKANQWIFIRGKFFDDNTAVIVSVAPDGSVSKIELVLAYQLS